MLKCRFAEKDDVDLYFGWANDESTRNNSYNKENISYESHVEWFLRKVQSEQSSMYVYMTEDGSPVGQVRIDKDSVAGGNNAIIGISVDAMNRGKGYSTQMLEMASGDFLRRNPGFHITAYIFVTNHASYKSFLKAGYKLVEEKNINNIPSYILERR